MTKAIRIPVPEPAIGYFGFNGSVDEYCERYDDTPVVAEKRDPVYHNVILTKRVPREFFKKVMASSVLDWGWRIPKGAKS